MLAITKGLVSRGSFGRPQGGFERPKAAAAYSSARGDSCQAVGFAKGGVRLTWVVTRSESSTHRWADQGVMRRAVPFGLWQRVSRNGKRTCIGNSGLDMFNPFSFINPGGAS